MSKIEEAIEALQALAWRQTSSALISDINAVIDKLREVPSPTELKLPVFLPDSYEGLKTVYMSLVKQNEELQAKLSEK